MVFAAVAWVAFAVAGPVLARRLPPAPATRMLALGAVLIAGSSVLMVAHLAATWIAQLPQVVDLGPWSARKLREGSPLPVPAGVGCALLVLTAAGRLAVTLWRRGRALVALYRCSHDLPVTRGTAVENLVVVDSDRPDAFATPLPCGRIVVTTGLLRALSAPERRAVLAHERSHLGHRHAWWVLATDLAAAANPMLVGSALAVRRSVERWADEDAARAVGDRALTARTVARVALLIKATESGGSRWTGEGAAATGGDVPDRVRALLAAPPRRRMLPALALGALLALSLASTGTVHVHTDIVFDRAATGPGEGCEYEWHGC
jgi:Zn-dependent protease with chaperone function